MSGSLREPARQLLRGLLHLVYPPHCLLCGVALADVQPLCPSCDSQLFTDPWPTCPRCAGTIGPYANVQGGCAACRAEPYSFDSTFRLGPYEGVLRQVVGRLKHAAGENLAEFVGRRWARRDAQRFAGCGIDLIVPVPLHYWRRWWRGYNQSAALAHGLSRELGLPCWPWALKRTRFTPSQTRQVPAGRRENVGAAFRWRERRSPAGRRILLVDDVFTTGSTASEAASALLRAGASGVVVAALARARS